MRRRMARSVVLMVLIRHRMPGSVSLFVWWFRGTPGTQCPGRGVEKPREAFAAAGCGEYRAV